MPCLCLCRIVYWRHLLYIFLYLDNQQQSRNTHRTKYRIESCGSSFVITMMEVRSSTSAIYLRHASPFRHSPYRFRSDDRCECQCECRLRCAVPHGRGQQDGSRGSPRRQLAMVLQDWSRSHASCISGQTPREQPDILRCIPPQKLHQFP